MNCLFALARINHERPSNQWTALRRNGLQAHLKRSATRAPCVAKLPSRVEDEAGTSRSWRKAEAQSTDGTHMGDVLAVAHSKTGRGSNPPHRPVPANWKTPLGTGRQLSPKYGISRQTDLSRRVSSPTHCGPCLEL